jgi:hypothetical protein
MRTGRPQPGVVVDRGPVGPDRRDEVGDHALVLRMVAIAGLVVDRVELGYHREVPVPRVDAHVGPALERADLGDQPRELAQRGGHLAHLSGRRALVPPEAHHMPDHGRHGTSAARGPPPMGPAVPEAAAPPGDWQDERSYELFPNPVRRSRYG